MLPHSRTSLDLKIKALPSKKSSCCRPSSKSKRIPALFRLKRAKQLAWRHIIRLEDILTRKLIRNSEEAALTLKTGRCR